jgi:hypothetical protein
VLSDLFYGEICWTKLNKIVFLLYFPYESLGAKLRFEVLFKKFHHRINLTTLFLTKSYLLNTNRGHPGYFEKLFSTKFESYQHQMNAKNRLKKCYSQSYVKKSDFDPPFLDWTAIFDLWLIWKNMLLIHVAGKNTYALQQTERKNIGKCLSYATLIFGRHIGHQSPSWIWQKKIFCEICRTKIQAQIIKQNVKMFNTHWVMVIKPILQPFWK